MICFTRLPVCTQAPLLSEIVKRASVNNADCIFKTETFVPVRPSLPGVLLIKKERHQEASHPVDHDQSDRIASRCTSPEEAD
jgi:hypothetical protein